VLRVDQVRIAHLPPLSFSVPDGECLAVEGPSGSGKTRLLRAIGDLDPVDGHIFLNGAERNEIPYGQWRQRVAYVAAEPGWWAPTAGDHLPGSQRVGRLVSSLGLAAAILKRPIAQLSTGERQRLALVRALAEEPIVLLLDEPTSALDAETALIVEELIRFECLAGRSVVLVSHDTAQIERLAHARLQLARPGASTPHTGAAL